MAGRDRIADKLLLGLSGFEVGSSSWNGFGLQTINVDFEDKKKNLYNKLEKYLQETPKDKYDNNLITQMKLQADICVDVDVVAQGDDLPFQDNEWSFCINSNVLEHFHDPIKTLKEWYRVIKPGGYLYMIIPDMRRTFDADKPRTTLQELIDRHAGIIPEPKPRQYGHQCVWQTEDLLELCKHIGLNVVDFQEISCKNDNSFTIIVRKD